jgi:hypothetical protein
MLYCVHHIRKSQMMNRTAYRAARALVRANGMFAVRWMRMSHASIMLRLHNQKPDPLADKLTHTDVMRLATVHGY